MSKNRTNKYVLHTPKWERVINFVYSIGAAIVILGAMFKLLSLPGANVMLFVGMITECVVFTISAFDKPIRDYDWEKVFPILDSKNSGRSSQNAECQPSQDSCNQNSVSQLFDERHHSPNAYSLSNDSELCPNVDSKKHSQDNPETGSQKDYDQSTHDFHHLCYDEIDLAAIQKESHKMAQQLKALNERYARILEAMRLNEKSDGSK